MELREKNKEELLKLLGEKRQELVRCRMEVSTLKSKNVKKISQVKKEIAQTLTLIREKELQKS